MPLDADYPQDRLEYMIEDLHEGLIITQNDIVVKDGFLDKLHHYELLIIDSDEMLNPILSKQSNTNLGKVSGPNNLAYVIYTSGSTGRPKGVLIEHGNLFASTFARLYLYNQEPSSYLLIPSIAFDSSVAGVFWTLTSGGSLVITNHEHSKDLDKLVNMIKLHKVTHLLSVPSLYNILLSRYDDLKSLKYAIVAGESCSPELLKEHKKLLTRTVLVNEYGPTEATVWSTYSELDKKVTIGKPIVNCKVYILDNNLNPCPIGASGELYIGGAGLARGYLNQDRTNQRAFYI